ncbi:MAG: hypothetical protein LBV08_08200 [Clostridiales bacterium]|nr:hypothetical protein [Clostridiales bacterium]
MKRGDFLLTLDELNCLSKAEINGVNRSELTDITAIRCDKQRPTMRRMEKYLEDIHNPYLFLCGETAVKVRFAPDGKDLAHSLKNYLISIKTC